VDGERDAEVGHQRRPVLQEDVLRLDVAVDHALAVRVVERGRDLPGEPERFLHRKLPVAHEPGAERLAGHERHDVIEETIGLPRVDQPEDVRVLQIGGDLDLGEEPPAAEQGGELGVEHLDGDLAAVPQVLGEVDDGHAALADLSVETVALGERDLQTVEQLGHGLAGVGEERKMGAGKAARQPARLFTPTYASSVVAGRGRSSEQWASAGDS
jgi:hypothetical protein